MGLTVVEGWRDTPEALKGASIALGNFDGVHLGHRRVLAEAARAAGALAAPFGAMRFTPHPIMVLRPQTPPFLLMTPGQQERALDALGVERLYDLAFDKALSELSAEDFAREVLAGGLGVKHVTAGFNVTFGKGRSGDAQALVRYGEAFGFGVSILQAVAGPDGQQYSSSAARAAIRQGDMAAAAAILGRPFAIEGVVVEGAKLGRKLGFPTANVALGDYVRPALGVYATRTRLPDGRLVPGVASVGTNPTVGVVEPRLEVWLFDFDENLYGQIIETELVAFLRPEAKFDSLEALTVQIKIDADQARALLMPAF
ncbi:MAG TPA: bifunctional riboflavin kinase/FAD synthetase [Caulobacteraceae bacterium]|nr:bifunctional riboflavin kinase/FAD synthetase [Caulobacteraceae bacterium]